MQCFSSLRAVGEAIFLFINQQIPSAFQSKPRDDVQFLS